MTSRSKLLAWLWSPGGVDVVDDEAVVAVVSAVVGCVAAVVDGAAAVVVVEGVVGGCVVVVEVLVDRIVDVVDVVVDVVVEVVPVVTVASTSRTSTDVLGVTEVEVTTSPAERLSSGCDPTVS